MGKRTARSGGGPGFQYAVKCVLCDKWRLIPSVQEFEEIRCNFTENPFVCNQRENKTCEDPADIEYNSSRIWVMDKPDIPKPPPGFVRELYARKDCSKVDTSYITPERKRLRSLVEAANFLEEHPEYKKSISLSDFSFVTPKVMNETIPKDIMKNQSIRKKIVKKNRKKLSK